MKFSFFLCHCFQIINVYNQEYESAAAFWPDVHGRIISALVISQLLLMGLMSTKHATSSTPFLIALPVVTIAFYYYCKGRYEPAFVRYPLQVPFLFFLILFHYHHTLLLFSDPRMDFAGSNEERYIRTCT